MNSELTKNILKFIKIGVPFGLAIGVTVWFLRTPRMGVAAGFIAGVLFPMMLLRFAKLQEIALAERGIPSRGPPSCIRGPPTTSRGPRGGEGGSF